MADIRDTLPHRMLMANASLKKRDFDADLTAAIDNIEKRLLTLVIKKYDEGDPKAISLFNKFMIDSKILSSYIYDYFVDEEEQVDNPTVAQMTEQIVEAKEETVQETNVEPVAKPNTEQKAQEVKTEPTVDNTSVPTDKNEAVLHKLFTAGTLTGISKSMLKNEGFETGYWSALTSTGQKCGSYRLYKRTSEENYNLEKIK